MQKEKVRQIHVDSLMENLYLLQKIETEEWELADGEGIPDEEIEQHIS